MPAARWAVRLIPKPYFTSNDLWSVDFNLNNLEFINNFVRPEVNQTGTTTSMTAESKYPIVNSLQLC